VLAATILAGWGSVDEKTGERCITNDEMRDVVLNSDDEFRAKILWQAERWSGGQTEGEGQKWLGMLPELLRDVWPRQKVVKTPRLSARLCALAFSSGDQFPELAAIILPLLTSIDRESLVLTELRRSESSVVEKYPHQTLAILHTVLSENVAAWPYGIEDILQQIGEADESLKLDERLIELRRKWNSR
jgi:hypothetical protein